MIDSLSVTVYAFLSCVLMSVSVDETLIRLVVRVFANCPGDLGSIPGRVIPKTLKQTYLTLSNIRYVSRVKWSNPGKIVEPSPTSRCSNYWKESLLVTLDYGRQQLPSSVEMSPLWLKHVYSILFVLTWRPMPVVTRSRLCSSDSAWAGIFAGSAISSA